MDATGDTRIALVHDWLTGMRGGEKCLEMMCQRWPEAPLYTLLHKRGSVSPVIENRPIHASFSRFFPKAERYYRYLLPLMPAAARWNIPACDLVISVSHCVAKAATPPPGTPHLCYCLTPMRYAWHMRNAYFAQAGKLNLKSHMRDWLLNRLRHWDRRTAERVTHFVAISKTVQRRIAECYGRESRVIYPPVDTDFYCPAPVSREDFYLVVSAFAPYKRIDLAVEACRRLGRPLVIIGTGQDEKRLRDIAGPQVRFLGWQSDDVIREQMRRCRALLFPGEEDFGIVPVEAQACGAPVIALGRGGAVETVLTGSDATGVLFKEQSVECLAEAMVEFERGKDSFSPVAARRHALRFQKRRFADEFFGLVTDIIARKQSIEQRDAASRVVAAQPQRPREERSGTTENTTAASAR
ncbi:MAG TPA: glycosyltransferase [Gemmataceae bacterium]|nr:glycosyltransferase [Gemmataceae bacterium]